MLGTSQSGIKGGLTVDPETHWHLLNAASVCGRGFLTHHNGGDTSQIRPREGSPVVEQLLADGNITPFYDQTSSSSIRGFALRMMMALFDERMNDASNALEAINALQNLDESNFVLSRDDQSIHSKMIDLFNEKEGIRVLPPIPAKAPIEIALEEPVLPRNPHLSFNSQIQPQAKRLDLLGDDVMFIVLDVETTGLDDKTSHIIQLAAKVLGSEDEMDLFSGKFVALNTSKLLYSDT